MVKIRYFSYGWVIFLIQCYRYLIRPVIGNHCRFDPSCSSYSMDALEEYGLLKGSYLTVRRLLRCHPFAPGGYDPVKLKNTRGN